LIITVFLLSFSGCGVKKPPYYQDDVPASDENVEFILIKPQANPDSSKESKESKEEIDEI